MAFAFDGGCEFFKTLFQSLQGLRFDHRAHLAETPNEAAPLLMIQFAVPHLAVDATGLGYEARKRVEGVPDQGPLLISASRCISRGLAGFVSLGQTVDPLSLVRLAICSLLRAMQGS
jgi:hypothetical protein